MPELIKNVFCITKINGGGASNINVHFGHTAITPHFNYSHSNLSVITLGGFSGSAERLI